MNGYETDKEATHIALDLYSYKFDVSVQVGEPCANTLSFCDFLATIISSGGI